MDAIAGTPGVGEPLEHHHHGSLAGNTSLATHRER